MIVLFVLHMFISEQHLYLFISLYEIQIIDIEICTYRNFFFYSICSVVLMNYFLKHLLQHYKSIIFIEDDTEGIIM